MRRLRPTPPLRPCVLERARRERGLYLTLVAVFGIALIGFCALVIELGLVSAAQSRLQNITNLAALGAIEAYTRYTPPAGQAANEAARRQAALNRTNEILEANSVWGLMAPLRIESQPGADAEASTLLVGEWIRSDPPGTTDPCNGAYPCFRPASPGSGAAVNAVRISLRNEPSNPLHRFFGKLFGPDSYTLRSTATATLVKRCTAYLLDVSLSVATQSHALHTRNTAPIVVSNSEPPDPYRHSRLFYADRDQPEIPFPAHIGAFAFLQSSIQPDQCRDPGSFIIEGGPNYSQALWCSMYDVTREFLLSEGVNFSKESHFRSDFSLMRSPFGNVYVDLKTRPEPLTTFLLGFNAGLRSVYAESSNSDKAMFAAFSGAVKLGNVNRRFPETGLTANFPYLIQMTNLDNIGQIDPVTGAITGRVIPNLVNMGILPLLGGAVTATATDIAGVLNDTISELDTQCDASDRRSIVLATDGISSCYDRDGEPSVCDNTWQTYQTAESQLLGPILSRLRERQISLTVMQAGDYVSPNFKNIPTGRCGGEIGYPVDGDCFLDFEKAQLSGLGGLAKLPNGEFVCADNSFVSCQSVQSQYGCAPQNPVYCDFYAHLQLGAAGVVFGRPVGVMAELAMKSGGQYCPILPLADSAGAYADHDGDGAGRGGCDCSSCTPCRLSNAFRATQPGGISHVSLEKLSPGEQAASCARKTVADNPFILVEE